MTAPSVRAGPPIPVGVDVLYIDELDALLQRPWFRRFVYADVERDVAEELPAGRRREFLAGRFAAKEAVLKVLRTGLFEGVPPRQIAILRASGGAPRVRLDGDAGRRARDLGIAQVTVSIAHKRDMVVAAALGCAA